MSIPKALDAQRDFSAGQIDAYGARRDDTEIHKSALRRARNVRPLENGALSRRPGRRIRYFDRGRADIVRPTSDTEFEVSFADQRFTARLSDGTIATEITGAPWTEAMLADLSILWIEKKIYVAHRQLAPTQVLTYDPATGDWTLADYDFRTGLDGEVRAPFYRFAAFGVTLTPSALTGAITLEFSGNVMTADHVGTVVRYVERQILITGFTDANTVFGTVIQELPKSQRLTVGSTEGFSVGEVVEGDITSARAEVAAIISATVLDVVLMTVFSGFDAAENLVGPKARTDVVSIAASTPLASVQWDEQFISDYRGWPGFVGFVRQRLAFADFDQFPEAWTMSAVSAFDDLKITAAADGGIFEYVPKGRALSILDGADPFVFTDSAVYFIPVSASTPLAPGTTEHRIISAEGAARVRPVLTGDGAVFVSASRQRIYAIVGTGQQARPYIARPISDLHSQLFNSPVALASVAGAGGTSGQHLYVVNADGTMVVGRYDEGQDWVGWFPWDGEGQVIDVAGRFDQLTMMAAYDLDVGTIHTVEILDEDYVLDGVVETTDTAALMALAGNTLTAMSGDYHLGETAISALGVIVEDFSDYEDVILGFPFIPHVAPFIENFEGGQDFGQRQRRRKIANALATVRDTHLFEADGRSFGGWLIGEDEAASRPGRDQTYRWRQTGRSWDPESNITQAIPGRFNLLELCYSVTI